MKRIRLGEPEKIVPSAFCDNFNYSETSISYPLSRITAKDTPRGFLVEFPIEDDAHIYGFGLQLKQFDHRGRKLKLSVNADPVSNNGDSHAPVPFFATNKGYGMYFDTARYIEVYCGYTKKTLAQEKAEETSDVKTSTDELYAMVKKYQPDCLINSRLGNGAYDYVSLGDNEIPDSMPENTEFDPALMNGIDGFKPSPYGLYETAATINRTWGFSAHDQNWKSPEIIAANRKKLNGMGINYLLNVGPDGLGRIPLASQKVLREAAKL